MGEKNSKLKAVGSVLWGCVKATVGLVIGSVVCLVGAAIYDSNATSDAQDKIKKGLNKLKIFSVVGDKKVHILDKDEAFITCSGSDDEYTYHMGTDRVIHEKRIHSDRTERIEGFPLDKMGKNGVPIAGILKEACAEFRKTKDDVVASVEEEISIVEKKAILLGDDDSFENHKLDRAVKTTECFCNEFDPQ